jgi:hypothetical protein
LIQAGGNKPRAEAVLAAQIAGPGFRRTIVVTSESRWASALSGGKIVHVFGWPMGSMLRARDASDRIRRIRWRDVDPAFIRFPELRADARTLNATVKQAQQYARERQYGDAERLYGEAGHLSERLLGVESWHALSIWYTWAGILEILNRQEEAEIVRRRKVLIVALGMFDVRKQGPLPQRPFWPGFALNSICYAALLWLLTCGPFVLRRFTRVRRGLCPACAYPMGEGAVCTECGRQLPRRAVA